uniref:C2H2-type domain-containing protein n=1 Tax=Meloidogyne javanica TaxID=6303 RepID=A0A915M8V4_MELJA
LVIANIDTSEKERRGEVKFRCEICLASLTGREQLRAHKREVHAPLLPSSLTGVVEMTAADGQKHKICQSPTTIKRTNNLNNEEEEDGDVDREGGMYPIKRPKMENDEEEDEEISKFRRRGGSGGETDEVTDEMMLQLLQRWEGENGHNEVLMGVNEQQRQQQTCSNKQENNNSSGSASPVSLHNATTSNCNITTTSLPEGFVRPPIDNQKSFLLQSFTIRTVSSEGDSTTSTSQSPLPEELVAYLPVRSMLLEPLKLTLELRPNPQNTDSLIRDQQQQHLENQKPILRKMENFEMCDNNSYGAGNEVVPSSVP